MFFSIVGSGSLILTICIARFLYEGLIFQVILIVLFVFLGELVGLLWKLKKMYLGIFLLNISIVLLIYLGFFFYPKLETDPKLNFNLSNLQNSSESLIGHDNGHPIFNRDTVYLVNFSFQNCLPCRLKKKYLSQLETEFKGKPFKIIEIHTFEEKTIFDESYMLDYPFVYHDSLQKIAKLYQISGGPEELIFNKKGKAIRRLVGFSKDIAQTYLDETKKMISKLLKE
jgi:thiol-disulfide isomerase/thioredoxin